MAKNVGGVNWLVATAVAAALGQGTAIAQDAGEFRQWEIEASGAKLTGKLVREFTVGSQAEGCVADDETGALYIERRTSVCGATRRNLMVAPNADNWIRQAKAVA